VNGLDYWFLDWINGWSNSWNPFLKFFSVALNISYIKIALGIYLIGLLVANVRSRTAGILTLIAVGIGNTITNIAKSNFPVHRPFQDFPFIPVDDKGQLGALKSDHVTTVLSKIPEHVYLRVGWADSMGTASAHSANMAAVAFVMTYYFKWWGSPWILVAFLTGISRIYTGAHYPSQVLWGWMVGCFAAFVVIKTWEAFQRRRSGVQLDGDEPPELA